MAMRGGALRIFPRGAEHRPSRAHMAAAPRHAAAIRWIFFARRDVYQGPQRSEI